MITGKPGDEVFLNIKPMKLIADSGSTKTIWMVMENGVVVKNLQTAGLNPYFHTPQTILSTLQTELFPWLDGKSIREVFLRRWLLHSQQQPHGPRCPTNRLCQR